MLGIVFWIQKMEKPCFKKLLSFTETRREDTNVYPPDDQVFSCMQYFPIHSTKVVIVGQGPYHGPGQTHGLSFSVPKGVPVPRSLRNIYQELEADIPGFQIMETCLVSNHGNLFQIMETCLVQIMEIFQIMENFKSWKLVWSKSWKLVWLGKTRCFVAQFCDDCGRR